MATTRPPSAVVMANTRHQQVLTMETTGDSLRSEAVGWSAEDPRGVSPTGPVGMHGGPQFNYCYPDPLRALADGWKLLAPPTEHECSNQDGETWPAWEWWFTREVA